MHSIVRSSSSSPSRQTRQIYLDVLTQCHAIRCISRALYFEPSYAVSLATGSTLRLTRPGESYTTIICARSLRPCYMSETPLSFHDTEGANKYMQLGTFPLFTEVTLGIVPCRIMYEGFAEQKLYLMICPTLCWERLEKHDYALKYRVKFKLSYYRNSKTYLEIHLLQLFAPSDQERGANV